MKIYEFTPIGEFDPDKNIDKSITRDDLKALIDYLIKDIKDPSIEENQEEPTPEEIVMEKFVEEPPVEELVIPLLEKLYEYESKEHYTPEPAPTEGTSHITDRGTVPKYDSLFTGAIYDMLHEIQMLQKQTTGFLNDMACQMPNLMHRHQVNPVDSKYISLARNNSPIKEQKQKVAVVVWDKPKRNYLHVVKKTEYPFK